MYQTTRSIININANQAIIKGIGEDGGLFVPKVIPKVNLKDLIDLDYINLGAKLLTYYFPDFSFSELKAIFSAAQKNFPHHLTPVVKKGDEYFLELFHGPTMAFKDLALSVFPHLYYQAQAKENIFTKQIVLVATSGDTGGACLAGFKHHPEARVIVFYPYGGVSPFQEKQMLELSGDKMRAIALKGNFDDCQNKVKELFSRYRFLTSANSINIARLLPQIVYYFHSYFQMVKMGIIKLNDKVNYSIPTGNFGNIFANFMAKEMGLPINKLLCASNENDVLNDFFKTGLYNKNRSFHLTNSPSMDILISSNLERLLWYYYGENRTSVLMNDLMTKGSYQLSQDELQKLKDFYSSSVNVPLTKQTIKDVYQKYSYIIDPHTAVAYKVNHDYKLETKDPLPTIIVSTASYQKFQDAVMPLIDNSYKFNNYATYLDKKRTIWSLSDVDKNFINLTKEIF